MVLGIGFTLDTSKLPEP